MSANFSTLIHDVFENRADAQLELLEERLAIAAAQAGDQDATATLIRAYGPALRAAVAAHVRAMPSTPQPSDVEDVRSQAVVGFLEALKAFDPARHQRLAATVPTYVRHEVAEVAQSAAAFSIPGRTLSRFFGILRAADGDVYEAITLAPKYEMRRETFLAVLDSLRNTVSYDAATDGGYTGTQGAAFDGGTASAGWEGGDKTVNASPLWDNEQPDVEDRILVDAALAALDNTLEKDVVSLAYGFADYEPVPDAEIGIRLGLSRPKTQRTRAGALEKMRSRLGIA